MRAPNLKTFKTYQAQKKCGTKHDDSCSLKKSEWVLLYKKAHKYQVGAFIYAQRSSCIKQHHSNNYELYQYTTFIDQILSS